MSVLWNQPNKSWKNEIISARTQQKLTASSSRAYNHTATFNKSEKNTVSLQNTFLTFFVHFLQSLSSNSERIHRLKQECLKRQGKIHVQKLILITDLCHLIGWEMCRQLFIEPLTCSLLYSWNWVINFSHIFRIHCFSEILAI